MYKILNTQRRTLLCASKKTVKLNEPTEDFEVYRQKSLGFSWREKMKTIKGASGYDFKIIKFVASVLHRVWYKYFVTIAFEFFPSWL
jgi:hypothetical protein